MEDKGKFIKHWWEDWAILFIRDDFTEEQLEELENYIRYLKKLKDLLKT